MKEQNEYGEKNFRGILSDIYSCYFNSLTVETWGTKRIEFFGLEKKTSGNLINESDYNVSIQQDPPFIRDRRFANLYWLLKEESFFFIQNVSETSFFTAQVKTKNHRKFDNALLIDTTYNTNFYQIHHFIRSSITTTGQNVVLGMVFLNALQGCEI